MSGRFRRQTAVSIQLAVAAILVAQTLPRVQAGPAAENAPPVYDEKADARADIQAAVARADADNKRVLIVWGGNWCIWCHRLSHLFHDDPDVARLLLYEYEVVKVDIGKRDKNLDLAETYRVAIANEGVPFITILDGQGRVLTNQETGSLEMGEQYKVPKVLDLLNQWKAKPLDAGEVYRQAVAKAAGQSKRVFLYFTAPWCAWCRHLDEFLAREDIKTIVSKNYVTAKIDVDRMTDGKMLDEKLRPTGCDGLPWVAILDSDGKPLATSKGPQGNVGFPVESFEIAHFVQMLDSTARNMSDEEIKMVQRALDETARRIESERRGD